MRDSKVENRYCRCTRQTHRHTVSHSDGAKAFTCQNCGSVKRPVTALPCARQQAMAS